MSVLGQELVGPSSGPRMVEDAFSKAVCWKCANTFILWLECNGIAGFLSVRSTYELRFAGWR